MEISDWLDEKEEDGVDQAPSIVLQKIDMERIVNIIK